VTAGRGLAAAVPGPTDASGLRRTGLARRQKFAPRSAQSPRRLSGAQQRGMPGHAGFWPAARFLRGTQRSAGCGRSSPRPAGPGPPAGQALPAPQLWPGREACNPLPSRQARAGAPARLVVVAPLAGFELASQP